MSKVNIHVWHTNDGQIVAIGRPVSNHKVVPIAKGNHSVMETEVDEVHIEKLHQTHRVDLKQKILVKESKKV
jgi:hypothetical protein